jgi:hypothetical protein
MKLNIKENKRKVWVICNDGHSGCVFDTEEAAMNRLRMLQRVSPNGRFTMVPFIECETRTIRATVKKLIGKPKPYDPEMLRRSMK